MKYRWVACACALAACGTDNQVVGQTSLPPLAAAAGSGSGDGLGHGGGFEAAAPQLIFKQGATEYVGPLTASSYDDALTVVGTDLGVSFPVDDKLYFLFGDSWLTTPLADKQGLDPLGWTALSAKPVKDPAGSWTLPKITWNRDVDNSFRPFTFEKVEAMPGMPPPVAFKPMKEMSVPVEGITVSGETYIFFYDSSGKEGEMADANMRFPVRSILARADKTDLTKVTVVHEETSPNFLSVSTVRKGDEIFIYGAGDYRLSAVHLAKVAASTFTDRKTWQYYYGPDDWRATESPDQPALLPDQTDAPPAGYEKEKNAPCVGEISVRKHPSKELYFMAYNCGTQEPLNHYVQLRVAERPEGPWSKPQTILTLEDALGKFVHRDPAQDPMMKDDMLGESNLLEWRPQGIVQRPQGDVYGPYLIPEWFSDVDNGEIELTYTISSWQPYQVHLMHTRVAVTGTGGL